MQPSSRSVEAALLLRCPTTLPSKRSPAFLRPAISTPSMLPTSSAMPRRHPKSMALSSATQSCRDAFICLVQTRPSRSRQTRSKQTAQKVSCCREEGGRVYRKIEMPRRGNFIPEVSMDENRPRAKSCRAAHHSGQPSPMKASRCRPSRPIQRPGSIRASTMLVTLHSSSAKWDWTLRPLHTLSRSTACPGTSSSAYIRAATSFPSIRRFMPTCRSLTRAFT